MTVVRTTSDQIHTVYGCYDSASKRRLDLTYDYEDAQIRCFRRLAELARPVRFMDVGANIGVYAIYLRSVESLQSIQGFEPSVETFEVLQRNFALQSDPRLEPSDLALSDAHGTATFKVYGELAGNNAIAGTETVTSRSQTAVESSVATRRLDDLLSASGERFVAKIDVEGHELHVIRGASGYLGRNEGVLQIECFGPNVAPLVALMAELGYRRVGWIQHDHLFTNVTEDGFCDQMLSIMFEEIEHALVQLQRMRRMRRSAIRGARSLLDLVRYDGDPVLS